ncbi:ATP-binding protein [Methylobacterium sp. J-077]|uniref:ATP-binding protein n=1 Tax=Methylobacterium sp. J-077 TaxID=2836656 RepID=UPI001FBAD24C|nr:ATP-binding protein [Methylobacterium sp. J-077]MCJ2126996.1 ATP-binding protein [Methylobacterium sp. J-077]
MSAFEIDHSSVIRSIRNDLQDRYRSLFSVLKELIQNADDAEAGRLSIDLREGIEGAGNPLLAGPGLLVVNDGGFTAGNERGIRHHSASSKTEEAGSAGRFGLGQKAVFHLCDAFVVMPARYGDGFAPFVINPFHGIETTRAITGTWEDVAADAARLQAQVDSAAFTGRHLALWLPLRRSDLYPAPGMAFVQQRYDDEAARRRLMDELLERDPDLATILAAARHLDRIDLRWRGTDAMSLVRSGGRLAYLRNAQVGSSSDATGEARTFGGAITLTTRAGPREVRFSGIEVLSTDADLQAVMDDPHWPSTLTIEGETVREKALPHGAGLLVRDASPKSGVALDWGVFLPTGERPAATVDLANATGGPLALHLFLHGYFFVDPGRRAILGLAGDGADADGTQADRVPASWNRTLRDRAVLVHLPDLLLATVGHTVLSSDDLASLVRALAGSSWFAAHRSAIGARSILAEVWNGRRTAWATLGSDASLRPLPAALLGAPADMRALLPDLDTFARERGLTLCAADEDGTARALTAEAPAWRAPELAVLLEMTPPDALRRQRQVDALVQILDRAGSGSVAPEAVGAVLRRKLREAIALDAPRFPPDESMRALVRHVPTGTVVFLPERATHGAVLRALACAPADVLVVRAAWQESGGPCDRT